jgi:peroxiredoxin (alkyl hydroperoxide reductase subunit C)
MNEMGETFKINVLEEAKNNNKKVLLFWYPKDFTFVCPTELHAFQAALAEFEKRNTIVIGASCDTPEVHFAWLSTSKDNGGIEGVTYPILADTNRNLSSTLGILDITNESFNEETGVVTVDGDNVTYRATYLLDENGDVFHESINHMPLGRNVDEFLRLIDAFTHVQTKGEVCPANWEEGKDAMNANRDGVAEYLSSH